MADPHDEDAGDGAVDLFRALGRQIKVLRERGGLRQKELGERLGYSEATISSVERGLRVPQPEHPFGGRDVQRGQLERLFETARMRNVEVQIMPTDSEEHAGMGGPFTLLTPKGRSQVAYLEVQNLSRLITDAEEVRILAAKYGSIRSQALTPRESLLLLEKMLGEL
ncbi:Scr1 family TA system antitoxin-like transcriptional regulator [Streptomyces coffeae]|uniref:Helix-turn-helix domain-containing protein n=1 Tax=Streptomyces coffeae TaxID=621382 RepID=A0ABS1NLH1_9ACTN|nr:Scr1 family TA system antitoxin-like transcriptional regulator [Streptomyces coffeae]MBL1100784.1 helix-turn-helix domain-containing protein [Streptomyces coffeae]